MAAVREHLASCPACRKEASYYDAIRQAATEIPSKTVSEDFNTRLLNRIAEERFGETRSKAYLPKRAPRFSWRTLAPVTVTVALLAVVGVNIIKTDQPNLGAQSPTAQPAVAQAPGNLNDSYLHVQPVNNPNVVGLHQDWSLQRELAKAERLELISRQITNRYGFGNMHLTSGSANPTIRFPGRFFPAPPTVTVYQVSGRTQGGEDQQTY
jgi:hypothetical protein